MLTHPLRRLFRLRPITPLHMMALMSPVTSDADVDRHTELLDDAVPGAGARVDRLTKTRPRAAGR